MILGSCVVWDSCAAFHPARNASRINCCSSSCASSYASLSKKLSYAVSKSLDRVLSLILFSPCLVFSDVGRHLLCLWKRLHIPKCFRSGEAHSIYINKKCAAMPRTKNAAHLSPNKLRTVNKYAVAEPAFLSKDKNAHLLTWRISL